MTQQGPAADRLNVLLASELAAVAAYRHALRSLDGGPRRRFDEIRGFADGHQRTVAALQECVRTLGGTASAEGGKFGEFVFLQDAASVGQLLAAEKSGLASYEATLPALDGEVRDLIENELIPRQRLHVATLSRVLDSLDPA
jgi:hypothetical protein